MVKTRSKWIDLLTEVSALPLAVVEAIVTDLTFPDKPVDLIVHPFVPLDLNYRLLGLVPHFPLWSKADENIVRVCSYKNRKAFDAISLSKEDEMRQDLLSALPPQVTGRGPTALTKPTPDLDLILEDRESSTVVLAELKWIRKPMSVLERYARDQDFGKAVSQLREIERFLRKNPRYLFDHGKLSSPLSEFRHIQYLIVARDHFNWVEPSDDYPVVEHDTLKKVLKETSNLRSALTQILDFSWLPVEGRDFIVKFDEAVANGVSIEAENFYQL
jgi:hypothetical protein